MADAEQTLRKLLQEIAQQMNYEKYEVTVKPISSGGANYTSTLYLATISSNGEQHKLFAKVAAIGEDMRAYSEVGRMYKIEHKIYTEVAEIFNKIQEEHNVPKQHRFLMPKFYGANEKFLEETMVLEDLLPRGYECFDRLKCVDWEYAAKSMEVLANWHALSFAYREEYPEEYAKLAKELEQSPPNISDEEMMAYVEKSMGTATSVIRPENVERFTQFCIKDAINYKEYMKPIRCPVLVHGDYRSSNLMHRVNNEGKIESMILVDYQTVYTGSPAADVIYFIITGTDEEFRKHNCDKLKDYYYNKLCESMRRLKVNPENIYRREDFEYEFEKILPSGLMTSVFILPLVTVYAEDAPKVDDFVKDYSVKTNALYLERMNGIVDDYIKWGIL